MTRNLPSGPAQRIGFLTLMAAGFLSTGRNVYGQEALRISLAGDLAAAAQKQEESSLGYYNLLTGPVAWRFGSGLDVDYNDNVRLTSQNGQGDFIFRPDINTQMHWPITTVNDLDVSVAAGYAAYARHGDLDQFFVNPGSGLSLNIYSGDFVFNAHDRVTLTENPYQNQSVNGNSIYSLLQNTAGANVLWNLNKAAALLGYDHANYIALNSSAAIPDAASENFFMNGGIRPAGGILAGVEAGGGLVHYSRSTTLTPDASQWNAGAFCTAKISRYMDARLDAGYTALLPDETSANFDSTAFSGVYAQFMLTHRVNRFFNYSLSAGRSIDLQYDGEPYNRYDVRLQSNWTFLHNYTLATPLWWEHGTEVYFQAATYDQYGAGFSLGRQLTEKLSGALAYQFVRETSKETGLAYTDNIISLSFSYTF